jgi:hypothetical protein
MRTPNLVTLPISSTLINLFRKKKKNAVPKTFKLWRQPFKRLTIFLAEVNRRCLADLKHRK